LLLPGGDVGQALGAARIGEHLAALLHVRQAVVEEGEHVGGDLFAETVTRAEILVDPDLHRASVPSAQAFGRPVVRLHRPSGRCSAGTYRSGAPTVESSLDTNARINPDRAGEILGGGERRDAAWTSQVGR